MMRVLLFILLMFVVADNARAVLPHEVLDDPMLETRAREISARLRCMVCQNQSIDDSDAPLAGDLRVLVRERLVIGESDEQVVQYLVDRYGAFILLEPQFNKYTWLLWSAAPVLFLLGAGLMWRRDRRQASMATEALSAEEQKALDEIMKQD